VGGVAGSSATTADASAAAARLPGRGLVAGARRAALVIPGVAWLAVFFVVPLALIFFVSLGARDELDRVDLSNPSLANYWRAIDATYLPTFARSVRYAAITTALCLLIGYPIAYWISRHGGRHKTLLLILVMLPFWTSYLIRTYAWTLILRDNGVVNSVLEAIGVIDRPVILMNTDLSVILGMTYGFLPFAILPLYVSIDRLDPNLVAAGRDLYATGRGAFQHITLPLTMPGIVAAALLTFIPALGDFVTPDILGGAGTTTIARVIQDVFLESRDWAFGAALGFLLMIITLTGTLAALRVLRREVIGA
jgi:spermidine/putrescine transport system permease protein